MALLVQTIINGLILGAGYALVAVGLTVIFGSLHIVNFAHGAFFTLGAYGVLLLQEMGVPYLASIPLAVAAAAIVGWAIEIGIVRRALYDRAEYGSIIVTFALAQAIVASIVLIAGPNPQPVRSPFGESAFSLFGYFVSAQRVFIMVTSIAVLGGFALWLRRSVRGQQIIAVSQNAVGALYAGIDVPSVRRLSFLVGIGAAALAGALLAPLISAFPTMGDSNVIVAFAVVILGGLGSIAGAMVGALVIGLSNAMFETFVSVSWTPALGWVLVILVLLFMPRGLMGQTEINRH